MKKIILAIPVLCALLIGWYFLFPAQVLNTFIQLQRSAGGLEQKTVEVDGQTWVYLEGGEGAPLVLVHGFGGNKDNFTFIAEHLTPHYRVIIPDLLGFGESDKPQDRSYSLRTQAEQLRGFVHAMGPKRIHIGGNSMGGAISIVYAAAWPDEVQSVWPLNPAGVQVSARSELDQALAEGRNPLLVAKPEDISRLMDFTMSNPPALPDHLTREVGRQRVAQRPMNEKVFRDLGEDIGSLVMASAPKVKAPTLIVWGDEDRVLHPDGAVVLDRLMPNSRVVMMSETGHIPMIEYPERTAEDYLAFRAEL